MSRLLLCVGVVLGVAGQALAIDEAHRQKADAMVAKAVAYLKAQQDEKSGGWGVTEKGPVFPAITGLVINGLALRPGFDPADPMVAKGVGFLISKQQPDGGIYDKVLPSYNTAISVSALSKVGTPEAKAAVEKAVPFLKGLQYSEESLLTGGAEGQVQRVSKEHPFYGGVGYGNHGRPDLSNTSFFIEAMHDAGVPAEDPAFQRALVFLSRVQMLDSVNDQAFADGSKQGGFIYATAPNKDAAGQGQSQTAAMIEETLDDGTKVSRLRAYGSMTYSGFKSLIYAQLPPQDPRVQAAIGWITSNYTLEENPGVGTDGLYYYYLSFARALDAWGKPVVPVTGANAGERDWANDLIDRLATLQNEDGSFKSVDDRWMESNPVLITAYAVIALGHARE
jgi:squalene-hopene/tetraprenyl-beta-curcumene cyclase